MKRVIAAASVLLLCAVLVPAAGGEVPARAAAAKKLNTLVLQAANVTPPAEVGREIHIKFSGAIVANGKKKNARKCRASRQVEISHALVEPPGVLYTEYPQPTPASGKFKGFGPPLDYGGLLPGESEPLSGSIGAQGGTIVFRAVVKKQPIFWPTPYDEFTCKRLTATASVQVAPYDSGEL